MMTRTFLFTEMNAAVCKTTVYFSYETPQLDALFAAFDDKRPARALFIADAHTEAAARRIIASSGQPLCVLEPGETAKTPRSVEKIIASARENALGRDALFVGVGGGVVTDLAGFAASVYMRGVRLAFVSTTLLGMVDASVGGKTGFDYLGLKNLVGTFYPARAVFMPRETLETLPPRELKSGFAELIKTMILEEDGEEEVRFTLALAALRGEAGLEPLIQQAVERKGRIVEADPRESGGARALLNLGHTFAHALEAHAGFGALTHGEAVAWGIAQAARLGVRLGKTPEDRARRIIELLEETGYETEAPHPAARDTAAFMASLAGDKKREAGHYRFVVPSRRSAEVVSLSPQELSLVEEIVRCGR